jgi:methylated-DNA-[protein]-cysteine S-methyltransferase
MLADATPRHRLIETAIGWIGVAWSTRGLIRLQLPERDPAATERRLLASLRSASPAGEAGVGYGFDLDDLTQCLVKHAAGRPVDYSRVPVDLRGVDAFRLAVYAEARKLGFGETVTYGELAARAGYPEAARATGQALGRNPVAIVIPCHRILATGGKPGGFSAYGGAAAKQRLLALEGVRLGPAPPAQASFAF